MSREEEYEGYHEGSGRPVIPWRIKNQLFMSQKGKCFYCGYTRRMRYLEIDHKYPVSRGGGDEIENLQLLCTPCNMRKGIQSDEEFRTRYWRLLPPNGSVPPSPIPQPLFRDETQQTRASAQVRAIYRDRFMSYRWRRGSNIVLLAEAALMLAQFLGSVALVVITSSFRGTRFLWRRLRQRERLG